MAEQAREARGRKGSEPMCEVTAVKISHRKLKGEKHSTEKKKKHIRLDVCHKKEVITGPSKGVFIPCGRFFFQFSLGSAIWAL